ncbi:MAG TPA: ABC transporter substrate-binding protein [Cyclobacteriaceae bacterium]|nr:ABC transporter substrate-binding protein [Cyclobacteriaceae bacterium]
MKKSGLILVVVTGWVLAGCSTKKIPREDRGDSLHIKYAKGFTIQELSEGSKLVEVNYPYQGAKSGYKYLLVQKGVPVPAHSQDVTVIPIPIGSIVCTSTTHVPLLDYLNETDKLVGFPTPDYISSEKMRKRIDDGKVKDLDVDKKINVEELYLLKPALVMGYTMTSDLGPLKKVKELGIPVVINAEYLERHPLGRAEWIKFMALFFNKKREADSVFDVIEKEYLATQELAMKTSLRPTVLSGVVYGDAWFMPGGKNYAATLLHDAGCNYLWNDTESNGFLEISFESVFAKAKEADLWIGVGSFKSLSELESAEKRYALFRPFKEKAIYTYNTQVGAKGGSEFLELGYLRPDLILKDLVKIAHPELLPQYETYFYSKLE